MSLNVVIADIVPPQTPEEECVIRLLELESLVKTYNGLVVVKVVQKKFHPDYKTYIGSGKLESLMEDMKATQATLLIVNNILKPGQLHNINTELKKFGAQCWDRVDLILKIFERHAVSTEARLQIELAAIKHMGPRIFGMGMELSRQGGGTGGSGGRAGRGIGETNTERMKRHLKEHEFRLRKKLEEYKNVRSLHRKGRLRKGLNTVGIVGYTNAGKSSLMQRLTGKDAYVADKLFATLGTQVGKMYVATEDGRGKELLINDTIGFIRDLPPELIDAFSSTLEDSIHAQVLIHLIDASDPLVDEKIQIVDEILEQIGADQKKLYVFNKMDKVSPETKKLLEEQYDSLNPYYISTYTGQGIEELKKVLIA